MEPLGSGGVPLVSHTPRQRNTAPREGPSVMLHIPRQRDTAPRVLCAMPHGSPGYRIEDEPFDDEDDHDPCAVHVAHLMLACFAGVLVWATVRAATGRRVR